MNILVYDIAAEYGGAVSVLNYYYELHKQDKNNKYTYILSSYHLDETENIKVINVPYVKKSWFHRLWFDFIGVRKILKHYDFDECLSLQNTIVPCFKKKQTLYCHNALPFSEFKIPLKEDRTLWIYQNVIGRLMVYSIKKADCVIVQTQWLKKLLSSKCNVPLDKISVEFPKVDIPVQFINAYKEADRVNFFYPANASKFKNYEIILKACEILASERRLDFSIHFTLKGSENENIAFLKKQFEKLGVNCVWHGMMPRQQVFEMYSKSILLFSSMIETVGLPIYEALNVGSPIIVSDLEYARNITEGQKNVSYFNFDQPVELADCMKKYL